MFDALISLNGVIHLVYMWAEEDPVETICGAPLRKMRRVPVRDFLMPPLATAQSRVIGAKFRAKQCSRCRAKVRYQVEYGRSAVAVFNNYDDAIRFADRNMGLLKHLP